MEVAGTELVTQDEATLINRLKCVTNNIIDIVWLLTSRSMVVPFPRQEMGRGGEAVFNITVGGSMLGVTLLFLSNGFLPRSPGLPSVNKQNDVEQHRRIFWPSLEKSYITPHIPCVRANCKWVWSILSRWVPIRRENVLGGNI